MLIKALTPIVAILCLTATTIVALLNDINGAMYSLSGIAIAGLGGYGIKSYLTTRSKKEG